MRRRTFLALAGSAAWFGCRPSSDASEPIGPTLAPADLAGRMDQVAAGKVAVLYVGPESLFGRGHIPGARMVGEAGSQAGHDALVAELSQIPNDTEVVLYCGCCPVKNCPNIRPASAAIRASGRTNARVLDLPTRFVTDWADKGFPVERT